MTAALSSKDSFAAPLLIDHHVYHNLHSLIFGEALFNDATTLALFNTIIYDTELYSSKSLVTIVVAFLKFFLNVFVAVSAGFIFGGLTSLLLKHFQFLKQNPR